MRLHIEPLVAGICSRSENLVKTSREFDRGRASEDALNISFRKDADDLVRLQRTSGYSHFSDGQLRWQDFIRPVSESVLGLQSGASLSRWFDTNTFYKRPKVVKKLQTSGSFIEQTRYFDEKGILHRDHLNRTVAIPGPLTLSSLVDDQFYYSEEELIHEFSRVLSETVKKLVTTGCSLIQINEPSLVYRYGKSAIKDRGRLKVFLSAFQENFSHVGADLALHTYFGDSCSILKDLVNLPGISTVGVDFTQTALSSISSISFDEKKLGCGCIDARSSLVETPSWISQFCLQAVKVLKPSGLIVLPSSDLKYLPRTYANQKVSSIGSACQLLRAKC